MAVAAALESEAADKKVWVAMSATADFPLIATAAVAVVIISPPCVDDEGSFRTEQDDPVIIEMVGIFPFPFPLSFSRPDVPLLGTCPGTVKVLLDG